MSEGFFSYELTKEIPPDGDPVRFYKRTRQKPTVQRRFSESDVREMLRLGGAAAATVFPSNTWPSFNRFTSSIRYRHHRRKNYARFAKSMQCLFQIDSEIELEALFQSHLEMMQRRRMMLTIDSLARRKNPKIDFEGAERLREALGRGHGAIIWAFQFAHQTLAGKRALWEKGFRPTQISSENHGFSDTAFGNITINPLLRKAENRYLKQRIVFDHNQGVRVTRKIVNLLDQGELVVMTNNTHSGNMFVEMRFGKHGHVSMPTAPLSVVARRKTPFFSMAVLETEPLNTMEAVVECIDATNGTEEEKGADRRDYRRMARLARSARDIFFRQCSRAPDQLLVPEAFANSKFEPR